MLSQFLTSCHVQGQICFASSGSEARRMLVDGMFDLVLVNTPLPDEFGHELAQTVTHDTMADVILLAKAEIADSVAEKVEDDGVFVIPKPLSRVLFTQALRMTRAARQRLTGLQSENRRLQQRIEDIRAVDRAKCLLIECCSMTEPEAHAYIEQQAGKTIPEIFAEGGETAFRRLETEALRELGKRSGIFVRYRPMHASCCGKFFPLFFNWVEKFPQKYDILCGI